VLPYGSGSLRARWEGPLTVLHARGVRASSDPESLVEHALRRPLGAPALARAAAGARTAVVVVSDPTRETALRELLPPIFRHLREGGLSPDRVSVLVAYGNHARARDRDLRAMWGRLPRGTRVLHHDSKSPEDLVEVGRLRSGRALRLNRQLVEAEFAVITGGITFHYHAGFTGGRKAILPGLASREDILANHALTLSPRGGGDPSSWRQAACAPGRLEGNPVHEEMDAAARLFAARAARPPFLVNSVLAEAGGLAAVFAGDLFLAFARGARYVASRFRVSLARPFDLVVASAGGRPRDASFYQSHKAFDHASRATRDGGVVVLAAECPEGPGAGMLEWFAHPTPEEHLSALRRRFEVPGGTALALRQKLARVSGVLVSRMKPGDVRAMGLIPAGSLEEALARARAILGSAPVRACAIPHAGVVLPSVRGGER